MTDPTDAEIDATLSRINDLAIAALTDHPRRARVLEMLAQGGWLFCRRDEPDHLELMIGWFDDPTMRPDDADPLETIALVRLPRRVILNTTDHGQN